MRPPRIITDATPLLSRHKFVATLTAVLASAGIQRQSAAAAQGTLSARLGSRDAKQLAKPIFNAAPPEAAYPAWLDGTWKATLNFGGYELPAKDLFTREELFADANVPGFQKVSIALIPDVGKENVQFEMRFAKDVNGVVREDRASNLRSAIRGGLGYDAVERIDYKMDPMIPNPFGVNPNRLSMYGPAPSCAHVCCQSLAPAACPGNAQPRCHRFTSRRRHRQSSLPRRAVAVAASVRAYPAATDGATGSSYASTAQCLCARTNAQCRARRALRKQPRGGGALSRSLPHLRILAAGDVLCFKDERGAAGVG